MSSGIWPVQVIFARVLTRQESGSGRTPRLTAVPGFSQDPPPLLSPSDALEQTEKPLGPAAVPPYLSALLVLASFLGGPIAHGGKKPPRSPPQTFDQRERELSLPNAAARAQGHLSVPIGLPGVTRPPLNLSLGSRGWNVLMAPIWK